MPIRIEDKFVWDSWYAHDGERWHGYFLQAPRSIGDPELRHVNVSQGHATSTDLVSWEHLGTCLTPSAGPAWDDFTTWTGSVVQGDDGLWHLFYTGANKAEDGLYQRIGHATARDMHSWERVGDGLCLDLTGPRAGDYESVFQLGHWHDRAMRDPWVMRDPDADGWLMFFTARVPDLEEPNGAGAIGLATSPDLVDWTLQPPVFSGYFGQLEVPQVLQAGGRWYMLFCTAAQHWAEAARAAIPHAPVTGTHYLVGEGPRGPWRLPDAPFLDGSVPCRRYAGRILETAGGLVFIGFAHGGRENFKGWIMDPDPVAVDGGGRLRIGNPE